MDSAREQQIRKEYEQKLKAKDRQLKEAQAIWAKKETVINNKLSKIRQLHNETVAILTMNPHSSYKKSGGYNQGWRNNRNEADTVLKRRNNDLEKTVRELEKELDYQKFLNRHPRGETDNAQNQESELERKSPFKFTLVPLRPAHETCPRLLTLSEPPSKSNPLYLN